MLEIAEYTLRTWGDAQTDHYLRQLEAGCDRLAEHPTLGRVCDHIRPGLRRMELSKHVIFYRQETGGILVSRILHRSMLPEEAFMERES